MKKLFLLSILIPLSLLLNATTASNCIWVGSTQNCIQPCYFDSITLESYYCTSDLFLIPDGNPFLTFDCNIILDDNLLNVYDGISSDGYNLIIPQGFNVIGANSYIDVFNSKIINYGNIFTWIQIWDNSAIINYGVIDHQNGEGMFVYDSRFENYGEAIFFGSSLYFESLYESSNTDPNGIYNHGTISGSGIHLTKGINYNTGVIEVIGENASIWIGEYFVTDSINFDNYGTMIIDSTGNNGLGGVFINNAILNNYESGTINFNGLENFSGPACGTINNYGNLQSTGRFFSCGLNNFENAIAIISSNANIGFPVSNYGDLTINFDGSSFSSFGFSQDSKNFETGNIYFNNSQTSAITIGNDNTKFENYGNMYFCNNNQFQGTCPIGIDYSYGYIDSAFVNYPTGTIYSDADILGTDCNFDPSYFVNSGAVVLGCSSIAECVDSLTLNSNPETAGIYQAKKVIVSTSTVNNSISNEAIIYYVEEEYILLEKGFVADGNVEFIAAPNICE